MTIKPLYEFDHETQQRIVRMHLEMTRGGTVTGPREGNFGEVYAIELPPHTFPRLIAAKSPRIKKFGKHEKARDAVERILYELEKTHQVFTVPWINKIFDVQIIHGWPFILSRYRDGSLEDLIANPRWWSLQDRFASLIQIVRALRLAQQRGIAAHQDLKPDNVFFDDLSKKGIPKESEGMHFHIFVADFGLADAFRDFGKNSGSRPYMAPEQYSEIPINPAATPSFDVFALGVIAFEVFTDGKHPIGETTRDVWPQPAPEKPNKWKHETIWRKWAQQPNKSLPDTDNRLPTGTADLILSALSPNPNARPLLEAFENQLWDALRCLDGNTCAGLRIQIEDIDSRSSSDAEWPHMEERLMQLRQFYSTL